jgi:4-amino-4-deoxy-L-arabinose transferase-like glycosyltransferase
MVQSRVSRSSILPLAALFGVLILGGLRRFLPERSLAAIGPRALWDMAFAVGLWCFILLLGLAIGWAIVRRLRLAGLTRLERATFSLPLGLGVIAAGVLGLGLAGLLRPWAIAIWLLLVLGLAWREWSQLLHRLPAWMGDLPAGWRRLGRAEKAICIISILLFALSLFQALSPPWDYDGLMYHLQGPRLFLQSGRIVLLTDLWQANGPFATEMLFTVGLAFGSDTFARLIHLAYTVVLVIATWGLGARLIGKRAGWIAAAVLLGQPIFPLWASLAYIDIAWSSYEFLGLYAVMLWAQERQPRWLVLAGLLVGYGMSCKYLGLGGAAAAGVLLLWLSRRDGWRALLRNAVVFGLPAVLIASPWYVKNWVWAGNPVYPLYFGGKDWDAERFALLITYLRSFGTGHRWYDYLLLPWNIYAKRAHFGTFMGSIDVPSPLFILGIFYPLTRRPRRLAPLALAMALRFGVWALGSHQQRFLLPLFPLAGLFAGAVLAEMSVRLEKRRVGEILAAGLVGGLLAATCAYSLLTFVRTSPWKVIAGAESKRAFLERVLEGYGATEFIQANLPADARVLMLWDGRGYYCDARCMPDPEASLWAQLVMTHPSVAAVTPALRERGINYLLLNTIDVDFWLQHDPEGTHFRAAEFFLQEYRPACTRPVFSDEWTQLYEVTCR